jgi:hypothetical protein
MESVLVELVHGNSSEICTVMLVIPSLSWIINGSLRNDIIPCYQVAVLRVTEGLSTDSLIVVLNPHKNKK